jgi:hypothetical protein
VSTRHVVVELVELDDEEDDEEDDDDEDDELVTPPHVVPLAMLEASGQPGEHAAPAGQQRRPLALEPHGVVPAGHPQNEVAMLTQATPLLQHDRPQGVVPAGQQQTVAGSLHVSRLAQHPLPHAGAPAGQTTALPRNGRSTTPPAMAAIDAPRTLSAPRRDEGAAIARVNSSNVSPMAPPVRGKRRDQLRARIAPDGGD